MNEHSTKPLGGRRMLPDESFFATLRTFVESKTSYAEAARELAKHNSNLKSQSIGSKLTYLRRHGWKPLGLRAEMFESLVHALRDAVPVDAFEVSYWFTNAVEHPAEPRRKINRSATPIEYYS